MSHHKIIPYKAATANSKKCDFASTFCVVLLEKRPVKILASFLVDFIAREHLAFLALAFSLFASRKFSPSAFGDGAEVIF